MKSTTFILIPGLNDRKSFFNTFYAFICRHWRRAGMQSVFVSVGWEDGTSFEAKVKKIEKYLDAEVEQGREVVLVGVSAGASLAMVLFGRHPHKIAGVVTVVGLLALAKGVGVESVNQAWYQSAQACEQVVARLTPDEKKRIFILYAFKDSVIDPKRQQLAGVKKRRVPAVGHLLSIGIGLFNYRRVIKRFAQRLLASKG